MTTKEDIRGWLSCAKPEHTHMLVICDTFDYEDYPTYIIFDGTLKELKDKYNRDM